MIKVGDLLKEVHDFLEYEIDHREKLTKCLRLIRERVRLKKFKDMKSTELDEIKDRLKNNATNMSNMIAFE